MTRVILIIAGPNGAGKTTFARAFLPNEAGHHMPDDVVRRRFYAGMRNVEGKYKAVVGEWAQFDNSGELPILIGEVVVMICTLAREALSQLALPRLGFQGAER